MGPRRTTVLLSAVVLALATPVAASAAPGTATTGDRGGAAVDVLTTGLSGGAGSTVGPDGALYVTEPESGEISRVDRRTGAVTTFASGLPTRLAGTPGGAVDVVFLGRTAYALVTLVDSSVGGDDVSGVYRVDGPAAVTPVADLGAYSLAHPPATDFVVPSGVQYAIETYRGGFLVTDGHHNRLLRVTDGGDVGEAATFGNVVPTGIEVAGRTVLVAEAGPVPHLPETGRVTRVDLRDGGTRTVVAGGRLLVDVELGRHALYGLSQGLFTVGNPEGSPADPDTGQLLRAARTGGFAVVAEGLDRPTSLEVVRGTAYVVTLDGEVWTVDLDRRGHGHR
ncbi:ScyD/ScyE family protein [Cellulomonas sp. 179-A 9B4 NHS]|uniref:ScyD/ScyE family protein n=1 Tax=Cellulomonas sp. 179-A 9B4 NHS TaxID=3142379 RepID=UPI0039A264DD